MPDVLGQVIAERTATLTAWLERRDPGEFDTTSLLSASSLELTDAEAEQLTNDLVELMERHAGAARTRPAPPDVRRYRVYLDVVPLVLGAPEDEA